MIEPLLELEDEKGGREGERVNHIRLRPKKEKMRIIHYQEETMPPEQASWADEFEQLMKTNVPRQESITLEKVIEGYPHAEKAELKHQEIQNKAEDFKDIAEI